MNRDSQARGARESRFIRSALPASPKRRPPEGRPQGEAGPMSRLNRDASPGTYVLNADTSLSAEARCLQGFWPACCARLVTAEGRSKPFRTALLYVRDKSRAPRRAGGGVFDFARIPGTIERNGPGVVRCARFLPVWPLESPGRARPSRQRPLSRPRERHSRPFPAGTAGALTKAGAGERRGHCLRLGHEQAARDHLLGRLGQARRLPESGA
jgi:hypothetical protein